MREAFEDRIPYLRNVVDGKEGDIVMVNGAPLVNKATGEPYRSVSIADRTKAMDLLAKYGVGTQQEVEVGIGDVQGRLRATLVLLRDTLPAETFD
jgi:hypothetical protein